MHLYNITVVLALLVMMVSSKEDDCQIDLVMVIDSSGSVRRVFNTYVEAALQFVKDIHFGDQAAHAAIIQYSKLPPVLRHTFRDPQSNEAIMNTLKDLDFFGDSTFTAEAVNLGIDQYSNGGRANVKKVFVLMTDGNSINQWRVVLLTSKRLQDTGANVYILGLGDNLYYPELKLYAGNGSLVTRDGLDRFKAEVMNIGECLPLPSVRTPAPEPSTTQTVTRLQPVATSEVPATTASGALCTIPPGWCPCSPGSTITSSTRPAIVAEVTTQAAVLSTTQRSTIPVSPCAVDILFVLDSSGAERGNFNRQIRFILDILDILVIKPDAHLVGAIVYDGHLKQKIQFSFTAYKDIQLLSRAVSNLPFFGGDAATGEALILAKQALKDRRGIDVPALVLVVTNGSSTDDVTAPAAALRAEPNTSVFALSAAETNDKEQLAKIAGSLDRVFAGMESESIKKIGFEKYLTCFKNQLNAAQQRFMRL